MLEVFGIAFSIMGLLPSIASTLAYSIPAGECDTQDYFNHSLHLHRLQVRLAWSGAGSSPACSSSLLG
jgi:hypothetical protein